jgi:hypothetical protein
MFRCGFDPSLVTYSGPLVCWEQGSEGQEPSLAPGPPGIKVSQQTYNSNTTNIQIF